jgi:trehalose/maltose transport system substrate-binding protein
MKRTLPKASTSLAAVAVLIASAALPVASTANAAQRAAATMSAPPVANAAAIKAKYSGQSITFLGGSTGNDHTRDLALATQFTNDTGIKVNVVPQPKDSGAFYQQVARNFSSHSSALDVTMLDVIWPGAFAPYLVDLKPAFTAEIPQQAQGIIQNDTVGGHLVAMPWFGDYGILYYRTDLLKKYGFSHPPATWAELTSMAKTIQAGEQKTNKNFYGFVFQGNAYEGLTCDALEWLASSGGGHFIDNGKVTINNPAAVSMLNLARSWVGTISPQGVTTYQEDDARIPFDNGNAAFMRNWPYAYGLSQKAPAVAGKFAVTVLPHGPGGTSVGTVGGWQLGVSKYSQHAGAATEWVRYLTSPGAEKFNAIVYSYVPTIPSVASDPAVRAANPYLTPAIANVARVTRPAGLLGAKYAAGSQAIYQGLNQVLNGQDASSVLPNIAQQLQRILSH